MYKRCPAEKEREQQQQKSLIVGSKRKMDKNDIPAPSSALSGAIEHLIQQGMPIDLEHIMAIKNEIARGHYPVSSIVISRKSGEQDRANAL